MSVPSQMTYGPRMTPAVEPLRPSRRHDSTKVFCAPCGHSEYVHADRGERRCFHPVCDCGSFILSAGRLGAGLPPEHPAPPNIPRLLRRVGKEKEGSASRPSGFSTPSCSSLGNYPTGIPINRLSSRNRPTTKMPMNPRVIKVLTLPGKCSHRSKSRSHHLSSPSPRVLHDASPAEVGPQLRIGENARLLQSFGGQCSHPEPAQHGQPASRTLSPPRRFRHVPRRKRLR